MNGCALGQQFGQGGASGTPYISWYVVSIYYVTAQNRIVLGIETNRYQHLNKLLPYKQEKITKKKEVAVFDEYDREKIDFQKLYTNFIALSEKIMKIGL